MTTATANPPTTGPAFGRLRRAFRLMSQNEELRQVRLGLFASAILSNLLALALPLAILQILDRVIVNQAFSTLTFLALGLVAAILLEQTLQLASAVITSWLTARQEHHATLKVIEHLLRVPLRRYEREEPSAYAEKLRAANRIARFHSGEAILGLLDMPFVLLFLALIWLIGGWLVMVPLAIAFAFIETVDRYSQHGHRLTEGRIEQDERRHGFLFEIFSGTQSIKAMTMERLMLRRYERLQRASVEASERSLSLGNQLDRIGHYYSQLIVAGIVFAGSWFVIEGQLTPGGLAACLVLSVRLMRPLRRTLNVLNQIDEFERANDRLKSLLALPTTERSDMPPLPPIEQGLELRNIAVRYRETPLFAALDLKIPKGACIAIQGASGTGTTVLMNLLCGMEQPDEGEVLVDERPLATFAEGSICQRIGLLPQCGTVVTGTILDNLTMFDDALDDRALAVARDLGLDRFVAHMKFGYETRLGENANEVLSGGTRQLISIVRALVREPEVILFDEANLFLDMETDRTVRQYLEKHRRQCTIVLVTYRPSYLSMADKTYHFERGALVEGPSLATGIADVPVPDTPRPEPATDPSAIIDLQLSEPNDLSRSILPLLNALGWRGHERELAEALPHYDARLDLSGFFAIFVELGYRPAAIGRLNHEPDDRVLPCLFLPDHAPAQLVLHREDNGRLRIFDGESGAATEVDKIRQRGTYYSFRADESTPQSHEGANWIANLVERFSRHRRIILIVTLLTTILSLAPPLFVRAMWDFVVPAGDFRVAINLVVGVLIAIVLGWTLSFSKSRLMAYLGGRSDYLLGINLVQRLLSLPESTLDKVPVAKQVRRIRGLVKLRDYFIGPIARLAFDLPAIAILMLALILINPWMSLVMLASIALFGLTALAVYRSSRPIYAKTSERMAYRAEFLDEMLGSLRTIRQHGASQTWRKRLQTLSARAVFASALENRFNQSVQTVSRIIGSLTGLAALIASSVLAIRGEITGGTLIATQILIWRITNPMQNIFVSATSAGRIKENVKQLDNLMRLPTEFDRGVQRTLRPKSPGRLEYSRVSFRYSNDVDPSLLAVNFEVQPGQYVAITGASGSGKSTLLKMVLGMYSPQAGNIQLDNIDIRQLTVADLRGRISYMPQSCDIFYGSVEQNLMLVHPSATKQELYWAAEMAGILTDADALPQGLQTRISGSRIAELPGGFRQRLSLARAMLKPAQVVLLDEPGTGMDDNGEAALLRCLEWLRGRATLVVVTLRPGHLRLADQVVYLQNARVAALGPYTKIQATINAGTR